MVFVGGNGGELGKLRWRGPGESSPFLQQIILKTNCNLLFT
ncbi:MAG: hypothetical protein JWQ34_115 [Mucilaginibacter sp.]|nr:hypothetical protein [Mucilaginibacter sp.]